MKVSIKRNNLIFVDAIDSRCNLSNAEEEGNIEPCRDKLKAAIKLQANGVFLFSIVDFNEIALSNDAVNDVPLILMAFSKLTSSVEMIDTS